MSDASSSKAQAADVVNKEIRLQEAPGVFCDATLVYRWHEAKARPVYYVGAQRSWATGEIHQVRRRDPAAEAAQATAWNALVIDFRHRLREGELEATGIPYPSADGRRASIPAELWSVLRIDWRRAMVWDGLAQKPAQGDRIWRDLRIRRHEPAPNDTDHGPRARPTESGEAVGDPKRTAPLRTQARASKLDACVRALLENGHLPGQSIGWKEFCDLVRDRSDGWLVDPKARTRKIPRRGCSAKSIERAVKKVQLT